MKWATVPRPLAQNDQLKLYTLAYTNNNPNTNPNPNVHKT